MSDKKAQKAAKKAQKKAEEAARRAAEEAKKAAEAAKAAQDDSDSSSSSDSDDEPAKPATATAAAKPAAAAAADDDDSSSSDDSDDMKTDAKPAAAATPAAAAKASNGDDDSDSSSSSDSDEETPAEAQKQGTKRKAEDPADDSNKKQKIQDGSADAGTVVVNNLSWNSSKESLQSFFESKGVTVDSVNIPQNDRGQSKGFAFVDVSSGLQTALGVSGSEVDGRAIRVEIKTGQTGGNRSSFGGDRNSSGGAPATDSCCVFIGNLSFDSDQHSIRAAFEQFGTVVSARVTTDKETGRSRGFGYCDFADAASAQAAMAQSGSLEVDGRQVRIDLANARPPSPQCG